MDEGIEGQATQAEREREDREACVSRCASPEGQLMQGIRREIEENE